MIELRRILVPTDFGRSSLTALTYGAEFAGRFGAELTLLHVVQDLALLMPDALLAAPVPAPAVEQLTQAARQALESLVRDQKLEALAPKTEVRTGAPFVEIIACARETDTDLIVMGTHGRGGLAHVLLGSVAEKVVRKAPCPVLTVRHPEHEFVHP
jgi:nucleotide-binding universal stress UspA family protein